MNGFWIFNATDLDFNVKFESGRYRVAKGETANLVTKTQGKMSAEQLEEDGLISSYISKGYFVRVNGPGASEALTDDGDKVVAAEVIEAGKGRTDRSVVIPTNIPSDEGSDEVQAASNDRMIGDAGQADDGTTTTISPPSEDEPDTTDPEFGTIKHNTPELPGALAVQPPEDVDYAPGLTPDENVKLAAKMKQAKDNVARRVAEKEAAKTLSNRLDATRCAATTGKGTQCRNKKVGGDYCNTPKHAALAKS